MSGGHVVVIGGGLAGIAAAIALRDGGAEVTLLETKGWLGGATCSFSRGGLAIDNGQHVFLRCCTAYTELLSRLGMTGSATLQDRFDVTVLTAGGRQARLRRNGLPAPLHLAGALARYPLLSAAERLKVGRAALALRFANPADPGLDQPRLGDWLADRWQDEGARRRLWDLFIVSALNIAGDEANVGLAAKVIRTALLEEAGAADIGVPQVPLGTLHGQAARILLDRLGARVRLGVKATAIEPRPGGGFEVRTLVRPVAGQARAGPAGPGPLVGADPQRDTDGQQPATDGRAEATLRADAVVLAVPAWDAARLVPAGVVANWSNLKPSPIVNVHVIYERQVTSLPFAAAVDSPIQWVFDKTRQAGVRDGQYLVVSQSAADGYVGVPAAELREQLLPALCELFPAARDAEVTDYFVTRERRATFRQAPGCGRLRPPAATSVSGFALAGAWTDTGWPDTMEGAVRSGLHAATHIQTQLAQAARASGGGTARAASAPESAGATS